MRRHDYLRADLLNDRSSDKTIKGIAQA